MNKYNLSDNAIAAVPGELVEKGWKNLLPVEARPADVPKSYLDDPFSSIQSYGYKVKRWAPTYEMLKSIVQRVGIVSSIINTRITQVSMFSAPYRRTKTLGFMIKPKDPTAKPNNLLQQKILQMEDYVFNCGRGLKNPFMSRRRNNFREFLSKFVRDRLCMDQACFEITPDSKGMPFEFLSVDGSTIRVAATKRDMSKISNVNARLLDDKESAVPNLLAMYQKRANQMGNSQISYVQTVNGQIINTYTEDELAFCPYNLDTSIYSFGYGLSEIEQIIRILTGVLNAESYNFNFFQNTSSPKGIFVVKTAIDKEALESFKRQWHAMVRGVENCFAGDSVIWSNRGAISIQDFLGDEQEKTTRLWDGTEWRDALVYRTREPKKLCKTTLGNGIVLSTSPDHKIRVLGESEPVWKRQEELQIGDYVLVNKKSPSLNKLPTYHDKPITPELMEVLGWMTGDGYIHDSHILLFYHHEKEQDIRKRHLDILSSFGLSAALKDTHITEEKVQEICERYNFNTVSSIRTSICLFSVEFVNWLLNIGFNLSKDGKVIPGFVHTLPDEYKAAFLRGFFSADGNLAKGRSPAITISNTRKRDQTRLLLLSLGIRTNLSEGKTKLNINGKERVHVEAKSVLRIKDRDAFFDKVGFLQDHKQPVEMKRDRELGKTSRLAPITTIHYARLVSAANKEKEYSLLTRRERMDLNSVICGSDGCSINRLISYMNKTGIEIPDWMENYHFEPVVELEDTGTSVPMFDVSVESDGHYLMISGVFASNSWKTPILQTDSADWINMSLNQKDAEFIRWLEYLIRIICAVYLIDPAEINFDISGQIPAQMMYDTQAEWRIKKSKDRGLRPLLKFIADCLNRNIIDRLDPSLYLDFVGLDDLSQKERQDLNAQQMTLYRTLNEGRAQEDLPPLPGGDVPANPIYLQNIQMQQQMMLQQQQMALMAKQEPEKEKPEKKNGSTKKSIGWRKSLENIGWIRSFNKAGFVYEGNKWSKFF